jgi:hypothetical protein
VGSHNTDPYQPPEGTRLIQWRDFARVFAAGFGTIGFFMVIVVIERDEMEPESLPVAIILFSGGLLLVLRALVIYRPQYIDFYGLRVVRGPQWSSTILGTTFVWLEVEDRGARKRIRLVEDDGSVEP